MENNLEKKIYIYSLYDKELNIYDGIIMGFDDESSIKYYFNVLKDMFYGLMAKLSGDILEKEKNKLLDKIHNSNIMRVAEFSNLSGEFTNDHVVLVDLFDYSLEDFDKKEIKKESEENN